jgi:hypothetical protein
MDRNTTGNLSSLMQGTESILKFGKANLVITAKKLANEIKTIRKLLGNLLIILPVVPVKQNILMKLKLTIKLFCVTKKIYRKLSMNSLSI